MSFDVPWIRWACIATVLAAAAYTYSALRTSWIAQGDRTGAQRVQSAWDAQKLVDAAESLRLQQEAAHEKLLQTKNAERIADEQARRETDLRRRAAALTAAVDSMHSTIEALNQRDLSEARANPCTAAIAREAATARELLGRCTDRYRDVAAAAEGLKNQVVGLLAFDGDVCKVGKP